MERWTDIQAKYIYFKWSDYKGCYPPTPFDPLRKAKKGREKGRREKNNERETERRGNGKSIREVINIFYNYLLLNSV